MAKKKVSKKKPEKPKGILGELDEKIRNNRKRVSVLSKKSETAIVHADRAHRQAPKNARKIKVIEENIDRFKKQDKKGRRRIMKLERKTKSAVDDLNVVKSMQFKDFEQLKAKVNEQSDFLAKESGRLNEALDSIKSGVATKGTISKTVISGSTGKRVSGLAGTASEDVATRLVGLYFQEIARTGFKKTLTLSEIINAYQYVLGRLEGIEAVHSVPAGKETVYKEEKITKEAENLMEDIDRLKETVKIEKLPERKLKGFSYTNKRDKTYYLHQRGKLFYFSKDPMHGVDKPDNMTVVENKQTGLPLLKKKR